MHATHNGRVSLRLCSDIALARVGERVFAYNLTTGHAVRLTPIGERLVSICNEGGDVGQMVNDLQCQLGLEPEKAERLLERLTNELVRKNIIEVR